MLAEHLQSPEVPGGYPSFFVQPEPCVDYRRVVANYEICAILVVSEQVTNRGMAFLTCAFRCCSK